jgi:hypothetical protein
MLLGVGYAALSDNLYIDGTLNLDANKLQDTFEKEVYFTTEGKSTTGTTGVADSITIESDKDGHEKDQITFVVNSLKVVNEVATFTFKIQNDNDFIVTATPSATFSSDYFTVAGPVAVEVPANSSVDVTVTVTLKAIPTNGSTVSQKYELTYAVAPKA